MTNESHVPSTQGALDQRTGLFTLTADECVDILTSASVGRIVFLDGDQPVALPVNFAWHENSVVFRTGEGQKMYAATLGQRVGFQVDDIDQRNHTGLSVLVKGHARAVGEWAEQEQLEQLDVRPWQRTPWREGWVRIVPDDITGRRLDTSWPKS